MKCYAGICLTCLCLVVGIIACNQDKSGGPATEEETFVTGSTTIAVDNTLQPIAEDVIAVFHNAYERSAIKQVNKTENEVIRMLLSDSVKIAVLPRMLTQQEEKYFKKRGIEPKVTMFASDAVALIANKDSDSIVDFGEILKVIQGKQSNIQKLVFDDANSSTVQYLLKEAGVSKMPSHHVFSLKSNEEVIKFVHDNKGAIGVIGLNWLLQPPTALTKYVENINVLGVNNVKKDKEVKVYYKPNQSNIATGSYPLIRKVYVLNYQGKLGLGMGFANYITSPDGQRIVLKSGLLPVTIPARELEIRKEL